MSEIYIEEFLYRGRPKNSTEPFGYHVILGETGVDTFGKPFVHLSHPLTPDQAEKLGFPLPSILSDLNKEIMREYSNLKAAHHQLEQKIETNTTLQIDELEVLRKENESLKQQLKEKNTEIPPKPKKRFWIF